MSSIVETRSGRVRGADIDGVFSFKGVPYAAPPAGPNRLRPPQSAEPWVGVRDAVEFGPKPPQQDMSAEDLALLPELVESGDDCLTLNIWSSALGAANQPVMVWIPGGMFEFHATGACPWYDGGAFARDGVVCVTISYRVGAEGFLYLGDGLANLGLLDQIAALEWVRDNIAGFGGDPGAVTVFGESAGGLSVSMLLAIPSAQGLFKRAIVQSGGAHHVASAESARRIGRRLAELMGVDATRQAIAAAPLARMIEAQGALRAELERNPDPQVWGEAALNYIAWQPTVDGEVLPEPPLDRLRAGAGSDIDLLIGSNTQEARLFQVPGGLIDQITDDVLAGVAGAYGLPVEDALAAYRGFYPGSSAGDVFAALQGDWLFRIPSLRVAEAHASNARTSSTYMYEFDWRSPQFGGRLGAGHALEIPFVFDTLGHETEALHGPEPPQKLADAMHRAWVAFAKTGDPDWPQYDLDQRLTMRFYTASKVVADPLARERALWEGVR